MTTNTSRPCPQIHQYYRPRMQTPETILPASPQTIYDNLHRMPHSEAYRSYGMLNYKLVITMLLLDMLLGYPSILMLKVYRVLLGVIVVGKALFWVARKWVEMADQAEH